jgi:hypothetical protein
MGRRRAGVRQPKLEQPPAAGGGTGIPPEGNGILPGGGILPEENAPAGKDSTPGAETAEQPTKEAAKKPDLRLALQVADLLWSPEFCNSLNPTLDELMTTSLDKEPEFLAMVATIPQDSTRAALAKLLRKRWQDGPTALETIGFPDRVVSDPGLLVSLKMLPRKDRSSADTRTGETLTPAQKKAQAEQGWMDASKKSVVAWRRWFQAAALAKKQAEQDWGIAADAAKTDLPPDFALNPGAKVIASYHVSWPKDFPDGLKNPKPGGFEIHYLYIEETNTPKKSVRFYANKVQKSIYDARSTDNSIWFDALKTIPENDSRRSVDLFITRPHNPITDILRDDLVADLIIEVMTIEIKNPLRKE